MRLLTILITYNRLDYTKKTLRTLLDTIEVPHYVIAVDNNSDDGTQEYLKSLVKRNRIDEVILNQTTTILAKPLILAGDKAYRNTTPPT